MAAPQLDVQMAQPETEGPAGPVVDQRAVFKLLMKETRPQPITDPSGKPMTDAQGKPVYKTGPDGKLLEVPKYKPEEAFKLSQEIMQVHSGQREADVIQGPDAAEEGPARAINMLGGATFGHDDELYGAAAGAKALVNGRPVLPAYREARDARRDVKRVAKQYDPHALASEVIGGLGTAPLIAGGAGLGGAVRGGAIVGALTGEGNSDADLTSGKASDVGNAALDTAVGGTLGAGLGAIGYGIASGAGRAGRFLLDKGAELLGQRTATQSAAQAVARDVAESAAEPAASGVGRNKSVEAAFRGGQEIEKDVTDTLQKSGKMMGTDRYRLKPSQLTGQRDAALAERLGEQSPKTMNAAQAIVAKAKDHGEAFLDEMVNQIAVDPKKLGTPELAKDVTRGVNSYLETMHSRRSVDAKPLYDAFEKAGGFMPESEIRAGLTNAIQKDTPIDTITKPVTKKLNAIIDEIATKAQAVRAKSGVANEDAQLSITAVNDIRKWLVKVSRNESSFGVDGMSPSENKRIAKLALNGIDDAFDNVVAKAGENPANAQAAQAVDYLRQANAIWKERTNDIRSAATKTVRGLINGIGQGDEMAVVNRLSNADEGQLRAVFSALNAVDNKAGASTAQNLRAQLWLNAMESGGKVPRGATVSQELGVRELPAMSIMRANTQREGALLKGAFEGDPRAVINYMRAQRLLQRLSFGPNIKGSDTMPLAMAEAQRAGVQIFDAAGVSGKVASGALHVARLLIGSADRTAKAFSSGEGIDAFNKALEIAIASQTGKPITQAMTKALTTSMRQAGLDQFSGSRNEGYAEQRRDEPAVNPTSVANEGGGP